MATTAIRVVDPRSERPDRDRQQGDDDREDGERDRRDVEQARADELRVLAPGDVAGVRECRLATTGLAGLGPRGQPGHAASSASGATGAARRRRRERARLLVGRPADMVDEDLLERRLGDLEVASPGPPRPRPPRGARRARCPSSSSISVRSIPGRRIRAPGTPASQASRWSPSTEQVDHPPARRPLDSRSGPPTTTRPRSTIAIDSHIASTVSIWWVEKIERPARRRGARGTPRAGAPR